jgi:hypothetical protein
MAVVSYKEQTEKRKEKEEKGEVNVAQRRGERMEQRLATASARTRSLLAGVCLICIIGSIHATGKSKLQS